MLSGLPPRTRRRLGRQPFVCALNRLVVLTRRKITGILSGPSCSLLIGHQDMRKG